MNLRRVLLLADESADWIVAGLRQLERIALSIDEFAIENNATAPVSVCILWRPDLDQSQRWIPANPRLTKVAFTIDPGDEQYDLVLTTRLFLYRKSVRQLISEGRASARPTSDAAFAPEKSDVQKHVPPGEMASWENCRHLADAVPPSAAGAWEYITDGEQIDDIERRFLRGSGKSQDGYVSRYLNRPISRAITRLLLRFPATPNAWTCLIFPIPIVAALVLAQGSYAAFIWGLVLFQVFSVLDGCDGEIARAKFMESESGRHLDGLFDVLSNIFLVLGLGMGLRHAHSHFGWVYLAEGIVAATLIAINEWYLATRKPAGATLERKSDSLHEMLYPRHRALVERSGLLVLGEKFASLLIQLTKRDVAVLFFVFLAAIGMPSLILHLVFGVTAVTLALAWRVR
jgi:phosphatidylglycerophosphate synthase